MINSLIDSKYFKLLSQKYFIFRFVKAAQQLYWNLNKNNNPIYLEYPISPKPRYGYGNPPHSLLNSLINSKINNYHKTIKEFVKYKDKLSKILIDEPIDPKEPFWNNKFISGLEAISLFCFPSLFDSKLYIEIGSGNSTKFVRKSIIENLLSTKIISIDPYPRSEIDALCDNVIRQPLEDIDLTLFNDLNSGDILMIDNSHRCFQNSDVTVVFLDILPKLKSGVLIYIDDIFLPYDYPPEWKFHYYSEQYLLAVLLMCDTTRYEIILPIRFLSKDCTSQQIFQEFWEDINLNSIKGYGNGFWLRVK